MSKKLLLIATGGTIASRPAEDGLTPEMTSEELLQCIPEVRSLCEIDTVQPFNLDSTNMRPQNWVELVKIIRDKYESYDGFVITHGTNTMAYAAASITRRSLSSAAARCAIISASRSPVRCGFMMRLTAAFASSSSSPAWRPAFSTM